MMLIRCRGYNSGVKEYLEEGKKSDRKLSRDELDERIILDGNLNLTDMVYKNIPDKGQDRYLTFTLAFKEDYVNEEALSAVTQEFKSFLMKSYSADEFNFYAEAHLPKIKTMIDKKSGQEVERKPHIHVVIPRINLLSGNEMNPVGMYEENERYLEAFQEYINQKYGFESPRDNMRQTPTSYADMLSRYKGDDFRAKNKDFKLDILKRIYAEDIKSRQGFYDIVSQYGEIKLRNAGKDNEYIAVKLAGDKKFTNLKESIFSDDFIVNRLMVKPPLEPHIINKRLTEWHQRADEIKYIDKIASPKMRAKYYDSDPELKSTFLKSFTDDFYKKYRGNNVLRSKQQTNNERSAVKTQAGTLASFTDSLQNMSYGDVASTRQRQRNKGLLPSDARLHLANKQANGNFGLRRVVRNGGRRTRSGGISDNSQPRTGAATGGGLQRHLEPNAIPLQRRRKLRKSQLMPYPAIPRFKNRIPTLGDIKRRGNALLPVGTITGKSSSWGFTQPFIVDTNSSSLSAWLVRRINNNVSQHNIQKSLINIERDFYEIKREVLSDKRFSYDEKNQLMSVIHFERLKRKDLALNKNEVYIMGSKEIRTLMENNRKKLSGFTISAPEPEDSQQAKSRFARVVDKLRNPVNYSKVADESRKSVEKHLDASNLYTKRTRKGHVHYLDKTSDKTLFVDTGKLISMRKNGLSNDSVAVALELAQGRFGSTLNIKGSQKFKDMVVNVVAEKGLDIHFTDKKMNQALELRRAELLKAKNLNEAGEKGTAFTIEAGESGVKRETVSEELDNEPQPIEVDNSHFNDEPFYRSVSHQEGKIVRHGAAPYLHKEGNTGSYYVVLKGKDGQESTQWGVGLKDALQGFRRGQQIALDLKESKPVQVRVRDENGQFFTREAVRNVWEATSLTTKNRAKTDNSVKSTDTQKPLRTPGNFDGPEMA